MIANNIRIDPPSLSKGQGESTIAAGREASRELARYVGELLGMQGIPASDDECKRVAATLRRMAKPPATKGNSP